MGVHGPSSTRTVSSMKVSWSFMALRIGLPIRSGVAPGTTKSSLDAYRHVYCPLCFKALVSADCRVFSAGRKWKLETLPVVTLHVFHEDVMAKDHAACPTVHGAEESLRDALVVLHFELDHHGCLGFGLFGGIGWAIGGASLLSH